MKYSGHVDENVACVEIWNEPKANFANTSTDAPGHVFSADPGVIGCFGALNIILPPPGDPAEADQTPACVQMAR